MSRLAEERHKHEMIARSLKLAGPERILQMGFSITLKDGHAVSSASELHEGDRITTVMADGKLTSVVTDTETKA